MFLVTTHLRYPDLGLLDHGCQVGDGADAAYRFLYPLAPKNADDADRQELLKRLHAHLLEHADALEPRLRPMIKVRCGPLIVMK